MPTTIAGLAISKKASTTWQLRYTETIRFDPEATRLYWNRGIAYKHLGNTELAIQDLEKVLSIDPDNASAKKELEELQG